jgi:hypothetical protein
MTATIGTNPYEYGSSVISAMNPNPSANRTR